MPFLLIAVVPKGCHEKYISQWTSCTYFEWMIRNQIRANMGPVLLRQGEPGTPQYISKHPFGTVSRRFFSIDQR